VVVFYWVVLDVDRKPLVMRIEARAPRYRPALHHAVEFEPEIVMQAARRVLLHHKAVALVARLTSARLRRFVEFALLAIGLEAHDFRSRSNARMQAAAASGISVYDITERRRLQFLCAAVTTRSTNGGTQGIRRSSTARPLAQPLTCYRFPVCLPAVFGLVKFPATR